MTKEFIQTVEIDFYLSCWCEQLGYTQIKPWKIQQIIAQDMLTAAELFVRCWHNETNMDTTILAIGVTVFVQDWRGRIGKFVVESKYVPEFHAKRIT